mgnify:CR=1 FL=1
MTHTVLIGLGILIAVLTVVGVSIALVLTDGVLAAVTLSVVPVLAVATVIFVSRAGLAIHGQVVELLHVMGAPDRYVARQFQSHVLGLAIRGGIIGTVLAAATLIALKRAGGEYAAGLMPDMALNQLQLVSLAAVPAIAAVLAAVTARITVMRALARMP